MMYQKELQQIIEEGLKKSASIDKGVVPPKITDEKQSKRILGANRLLQYLATASMKDIISFSQNDDCAILLFTPENYLLRIETNDSFSTHNCMDYFQKLSSWDERKIGFNITSLKHYSTTPVHLPKGKSYANCLSKYNYCMNQIDINGLVIGYMVFLSAFASEELISALIVTLTNKIKTQIFWIKSSTQNNDVISGNGGTVIIDQALYQNRILTITPTLLNILDIKDNADSLAFKNLTSIIREAPDNKELWNIITKKKTVYNERLELKKCNGSSIIVLVSTCLFSEPSLGLSGLTLTVRPEKIIEKEKSKQLFDSIITNDSHMIRVISQAKVASSYSGNILLLGESGVGKDIFARAIHYASDRCKGPFIALNCAAFSPELIASELFGYEGGSFSGSNKEGHMGKLELANGGTLFLDEIGDMPLQFQALLLRVIEEKAFRKVGGNKLIQTDVRIITATNKNLYDLIETQQFRSDLFYRISVITIHIPPLRERGNDVLLLSNIFIKEKCSQLGRATPVLTRGAEQMLSNYHWPGNIRELHNTLENLLCTTSSTVINKSMLESYFLNKAGTAVSLTDYADQKQFIGKRKYFTKENIIQALDYCNGHREMTANFLGISRSTLQRLIKKYNL